MVARDAEQVAQAAAALIADQVSAKPDSVICVATGATLTRAYALLAERASQCQFPTDRLRLVKLDEWLGLPMRADQSCDSYLRKHLLGPLNIPDENYIALDSEAPDTDAECERVIAAIAAAGGLDLAVLGIGTNGHLGLNEPGDSARPFCHVSMLTAETAGHAMLAGIDVAVTRGVTLGIGDVLRSRRILLLATGGHKAEAMRRLKRGTVTPALPASFLWLHPDVTCLCDAEAATMPEP